MAGLLDDIQWFSSDMFFFFLRYYFGFWNHLRLNSASYDFICHSQCYFWFSLPLFLQSFHAGLILSGKLALLWDSFHKNLHRFSISFNVSLSPHVSLSRWCTPPFFFLCPPPISVLSLLSLVFFSVWTDLKQADLFFLCRTLDHIQ